MIIEEVVMTVRYRSSEESPAKSAEFVLKENWFLWEQIESVLERWKKKMANMTQCKKIVEYCEQHGSITHMEASRCLHVERLASRIFDLKCSGYKVQTEMVRGVNRDGERIAYAKYIILEAPKKNEKINKDGNNK